MAKVVVFLTTADTSPWAVPADWNPYDNSVEVINSGHNSDGAGGGGDGGAYAKRSNLNISGNISYTVGIPSGTLTTFNTGNPTEVAGGSIGTTLRAGGSGGVGGPTHGGGGGGAAGKFGTGISGSGVQGGHADNADATAGVGGVSPGDNGADGQEYDATHGSGGGGAGDVAAGVAGNGGNYGGGGGATQDGTGTQGTGANGLIIITYNTQQSAGFFL